MKGLIGWWMVRSGLNLDPEQLREIRVSPYRLATHLGMAFTTYSVLLWTGTAIDSSHSISQRRATSETDRVQHLTLRIHSY